MEYLLYAGALIIGVIVGTLIGIFIGIERMSRSIKDQTVGYLRIDRSEPDELPRPFLELQGSSIESISTKDYITLKIINKNYLSRD